MGVLAVVFVATAALAVAAVSQRGLVLFNHSPSMPLGFYGRQATSSSRLFSEAMCMVCNSILRRVVRLAFGYSITSFRCESGMNDQEHFDHYGLPLYIQSCKKLAMNKRRPTVDHGWISMPEMARVTCDKARASQRMRAPHSQWETLCKVRA